MKNPVLKKAIALAMGASLAVSIPVMAASGDEVVRDDTYKKTVTVKGDGENFGDYTTELTLTVKDGKFTAVSSTDPADEDNQEYIDWAMKGRTRRSGTIPGLENALVGNDATQKTVESWDSVSGATYSSEGLKKAALDIIAEAPVAGKDSPASDSTSKAVYVMMNIPYDAFYGAEDAKNFDTDAVSSATNKVGNTGFAGGGYHSAATANIKEDGTLEAVGGANGAHMEGVTWPVKAESLDAVKALGGKEVTEDTKVTVATAGHGAVSSSERTGADALMEAPSYSYYVLANEPAYYLELSGDEKAPVFSSLKG
ncbi:MAG: FMN-binding protein, partial [Bacteroidales bacterium]|nr:FMN-binding protein [Bacteroidales bacterium]